ncbi:MAG: UvrD-helicase domain-containing protein [bacterium]|nr:UvrD-helicase domain-containing protein [bacterium]
MDTALLDTSARQEAIDPCRSFIVQAPAGSGKTSLLIQRFLQLLAQVDKPEQVLAITFTRKAAEEMRDRVIAELQKARRLPQPPAEAYAAQTWELAQTVLQRDQQLGWHLLLAKERLRIKTIDSFCLYLASRLPLGSHFGAPLAPSEDSEPLYQQAVLSALSAIDALSPDDAAHIPARQAYENMLRFCNNDKGQLISDLCTSLQNRSLWQQASHSYLLKLAIGSQAEKDATKAELNRQLTSAVRSVILEPLQELDSYFRSEQLTEHVRDLMNHALNNLAGKDSNLRTALEKGLDGLTRWPAQATGAYFSFYKALSALFLSSGTVRKTGSHSLTAKQGFPSKTEHDKIKRQEFADILDSCREELQTVFDRAKDILSLELPNDDGSETAYRYSEEQFTNLRSVAYLLEICYAYLREAFRRFGICDYTEIAHNAIEALGSDNTPSELALQLDSDIKHILVDEYQDTSQAQLELLERLTASWQPVRSADADSSSGDREQEGRTIFMVGDPMQSIYRFRQADVGIYLRTQEHGLSKVTPTPQILQTNFRSAPSLISWFNETFRSLFPDKNDISTSAIRYPDAAKQAVAPLAALPSAAADAGGKDSQANPAGRADCGQPYQYHIHPAISDNIQREEAQYTVDLACRERERLLAAAPGRSKPPKLAILFQKKSSAKEVIKLLRHANIPYQATDMEPLSESEPVRDLISLTKALLHLNDRLSWLALLRSPLVGLNDNEITRLVEDNLYSTVWDLLSSPHCCTGASWQGTDPQQLEEVRERCQRLRDAVAHALEVRGEQAFSRWIRGTWMALGGPLTLKYEQEGDLVSEYFAYLEELEAQGLPDAAELERTLDKRSAEPHSCAPESIPVQLMTMHAAKGLEFDTVILPFLNSQGNTSENGLLRNTAVYADESGLIPSTVFAVQIDKKKTLDLDYASSDEDSSENKDSSKDADAAQADETGIVSPNTALYGHIQKQCRRNELKRLFYVAATRAQQRLHLVLFAKQKEDHSLNITANTMAELLLQIPEAKQLIDAVNELLKSAPAAAESCANITTNITASASSAAENTSIPAAEATEAAPQAAADNSEKLLPISRLSREALEKISVQWLPPLGLEIEDAATSTVPSNALEKAATYGTVFHSLMELIGQYALTLADLRASSPNSAQDWANDLISEALALQKVDLDSPNYGPWQEDLRCDLQAMLDSPQGRWAIEPHDCSSYEQCVCSAAPEGLEAEERRLDRIFTSGGKFWIIDYKTGHDRGHKPSEYHEIMELYAQRMMQSQGYAEINLALVYVNHKRPAKCGGPVYLDCGCYRRDSGPAACAWGLPAPV